MKAPCRRFLLVPLLALLSGCVLLQPTRVESPPLLDPTARQRAGSTRASLPSGPLTLERAVAIALESNPDLGAGVWDVEAARARTRQARSGHWPTVGIAAALRHHWHEERLVPARGQSPADAAFAHDIFAGDLVVSIPLAAGGRVVSAVAASKLLARAAESRLARTRGELVFNVKSTFYGILGQARLVKAIEHSRRALTEHRRKTEALIAARKAAPVDLLNLEVRLAELDHRLVKQRGVVQLLKRLFSSQLGLDRAPPGGLAVQGELRPRRDCPDAARLLVAAVAARPDLRELALSIEAQAKRVDMARAEYWPSVAAKGTFGSRLSLKGDYDDLGFVGLELALPILAGPGITARVAEERARLRLLEEQRRKLVLGVRREIESAEIQVKTAIAQVAATEKAIAMARESLRIARDKAALGHGTAMDVLDAQAALLGTETTYFAALAELHTAHALLELAAGGAS